MSSECGGEGLPYRLDLFDSSISRESRHEGSTARLRKIQRTGAEEHIWNGPQMSQIKAKKVGQKYSQETSQEMGHGSSRKNNPRMEARTSGYIA